MPNQKKKTPKLKRKNTQYTKLSEIRIPSEPEVIY